MERPVGHLRHGFRDYDPATARFISRDMYNGAAADMNLGADPATASRYAFAAGNPVNNIELDGHESCDVGCQARREYRMDGDPVIPDPETLEFNVQHHDGSTGLENWVDLGTVFKELSGLADIQGCWNDPSAWQCSVAAASAFPGAGKTLKGAKLLDEAADAGRGAEHVVLGINPHSDDLVRQLRKAGDTNVKNYNGPQYGNPDPNGDGRPMWMSKVQAAIDDGDVKLSVALDGVTGATSPRQALDLLVEQGRPLIGDRWDNVYGNGTAWEMALFRLKVLREQRTWESIDWYWAGSKVDDMPRPNWAG
ncbi:polymorphic toxin type 27 domain-containing protein [Streptomyces sp. NPDC018833]|uniref:polymorphic toxin type 27 domain-containing protein n=1 Tax=Streptomyces sp. NPDC018833 TaxID=3365053 RepID=UPI00379554AF